MVAQAVLKTRTISIETMLNTEVDTMWSIYHTEAGAVSAIDSSFVFKRANKRLDSERLL